MATIVLEYNAHIQSEYEQIKTIKLLDYSFDRIHKTDIKNNKTEGVYLFQNPTVYTFDSFEENNEEDRILFFTIHFLPHNDFDFIDSRRR